MDQTKCHATLAFVILLSGASITAQAVPITGLFNTGVDGSGSALGAGATDSHYSLRSPAQGAIVIKDAILGTWIPNSLSRRWIWQTVDGTLANVTLTFRTTFDLTGLDIATAVINGQWAADNTGLDIFIDGVSTGNFCGGFDALCGFSVTSGFTAGINNLDFQVRDVGVIAGLWVSSISGTADAAVPEPATLALLGLGLAGIGFRRHKVA